jgi:16S rRNA A1518/A1519 N6-dimethyltransferase RsmA/KsgA/DIM1 with predicted DNA glycosylase/AP lyase activity
VRSALLRLRFHAPLPAARDDRAFQGLVRAVFTRRRKTLANALTAYTAPLPFSAPDVLRRAEIDPRRRPETLDLVEFVRLSNTIGDRTSW